MKKILSYLLAICMMMSVCSLFAVNTEATYGYLLGDADDNAAINVKDILLARRYAAGLATEKDLNVTAADADKNGSVNLKDILLIRKHVAGAEYLEGVNEDGKYKVGTVSIGGKNITRFSIVIPDDATECMKNAAKVLRNKISAACGYELSVSKYGESANAYNIRFAFDENNENELGLEGYRVCVDDNGDLNVICGSSRGPIYAAYFILEEFIGYRYFLGISNFLYASDSVDIPASYDTTEVPAYSYRALSQAGGSDHSIELRLNDSNDAKSSKNGGRVGTPYLHAHSYAALIQDFDDMYNWDLITPEEQRQPCLSDQALCDKMVDNCVKLAIQRESWGQLFGESWTQISCSPNDNTNFCTCTRCKEIYAIEGSIAGTVFRLANKAAEALKEVYPDAEIYTIAYWDARNPPKFTRPDDSICVCYCFGGCNNHTYDDVESCIANGGNPRYKSPTGEFNSNEEDMRFLDQWAELTDNIQIWYYSTAYHYYFAPAPNVVNVYNDFKTLAALGATGMYNEGSSTGYTFERLRGYLAAKMMWNPYMSEEEFNNHVNEYLAAYYGEGWAYIREYLNMQTEAGDLNGCWTNNFDRPWNMYNEEYFGENYNHMSDLFDKALAMAKTSDEIKHVKECRLHVDFLGLSATYESDYVNGDSETKATYVERYKNFYNVIVSGKYQVSDVGDSDTYGCEQFPASADEVTCPMTWLWEGCTGYWVYQNGYWG